MPLNGLLGDCEIHGDKFVGFTAGDESQHHDLARREAILGHVHRESVGDFRLDQLTATVNGTT